MFGSSSVAGIGEVRIGYFLALGESVFDLHDLEHSGQFLSVDGVQVLEVDPGSAHAGADQVVLGRRSVIDSCAASPGSSTSCSDCCRGLFSRSCQTLSTTC